MAKVYPQYFGIVSLVLGTIAVAVVDLLIAIHSSCVAACLATTLEFVDDHTAHEQHKYLRGIIQYPNAATVYYI